VKLTGWKGEDCFFPADVHMVPSGLKSKSCRQTKPNYVCCV
jgi:hypothetical protein